ncbi:Peptidase C26 - like 5, partial [Theobroma cacao]
MWNYLLVPILFYLSKDLSLAKAHTSTPPHSPNQHVNDYSADTRSSTSNCTTLDPVIGILSHRGDGASGRLNNDTNASYVKFMEAAGVRVIPLTYNEHEEILFEKLELVNGVLFTGGWDKAGFYYEIKVVEKNKAGDHFPLYAICLGFETLTMIISGFRVLSTLLCVLVRDYSGETWPTPACSPYCGNCSIRE